MKREKNIKVDGLRMISSTNTQVRRLEVISAITREIGRRMAPMELLKSKMIEWSFFLEANSSLYYSKNGKLTHDTEVTTAFPKYISLMKEMGIIHKLGSVISLTTNGHILNDLIKQSNQLSDVITKEEKLFYLYILFSKDADYLLLVLDMIKNEPLLSNQTQLQKKFEKSLLQRLKSKALFSERSTLMNIEEKRRVVSVEWLNSASYAEHIIAPRLEWLIDLNVLKKEDNRYLFTDEGEKFLESFLSLKENESVSDINNEWITEKAFSSFRYLFSDSMLLRDFKDLTNFEQNKIIGECLLISSNLFRSGSALRIGLQPSLIFSSIHSFYKENVVLEFKQLVEKVKQVFVYKGKQYQMKGAARITEGYITIKIEI
jgi:hypothetical protein